MQRQFVIAKSPFEDSRLPLLLSLPLAPRPLLLATRANWPVDKDLYCHEVSEWPEGSEIVDCVPVISCQRRGSSIELVLDRPQRRRSLFVFTASKQGKRLVFWRSERSMHSTRPGVRAPQARGLDGPMTVIIDSRERYPWRFLNNPVTTERRRLPVGDYGVFDGDELAAVVERKKLQEFVGAAVNGQLALAMAELATMPRAAVIIEGRLSKLLASDQTRVRPGWMLNLTAALQAAYPNVPLLFTESGSLAADLAYRWLSACMSLRRAARRGQSLSEALGEALDSRGTVATAPLFAPSEQVGLALDAGRSVKRSEAPPGPSRPSAAGTELLIRGRQPDGGRTRERLRRQPAYGFERPARPGRRRTTGGTWAWTRPQVRARPWIARALTGPAPDHKQQRLELRALPRSLRQTGCWMCGGRDVPLRYRNL